MTTVRFGRNGRVAPPPSVAVSSPVASADPTTAVSWRGGWLALCAATVARAVFVILAGLVTCSLVPAAFGWHPTVVMTGSMEPRLHVGDVVVSKPTPNGQLRRGLIVLAEDPDHPGQLRMHRIAALNADRTLTLRGDANPANDSTPVKRSAVLGVATLRAPWIGQPLVWLSQRDYTRVILLGLALGLLTAGAFAFEAEKDEDDPHEDDTDAAIGTDRPQTARHPWRRARAVRPSAGAALLARPQLRALLLVGALLAAALPASAASALSPFRTQTSNTGNSFGASGQFDNYPQQVLADNPSVYYRQDDAVDSTVAHDSAAGSDGVYAGSAGVYRQPGSPADPDGAVTFPGTSGAHAYSDASSSPTVCTAEVWFNTTTTSGGKLIGFGDNQTGNSFGEDREIGMLNDGRLQAFAGDTKITSTSSYNDGTWHMAAMSVGPAGEFLFVDGVQVASSTSTTAGQSFSGYWRIGGDSFFDSSSAYLAATMDDASVYTTQLSAGRIAAHYAAATNASAYTSAVLADNPWGFWHLNDPGPSSGTTAVMVDSSGNNHPGHYVNLPTKTPTGGQPGALGGSQATSTAEQFAGTGNGYWPTAVTNPTTFTLECWFKTTTTSGGELMGFGDTQTGNSTTYDRTLYMRDDGRLEFETYDGSFHSMISPAAENDGAWHYLVLSYSANAAAMYVDGTPAASSAAFGAAASYTGYWRWGGGNLSTLPNQPGAAYFTGTMDEVAIYPTSLTATQVALHYGAANR